MYKIIPVCDACNRIIRDPSDASIYYQPKYPQPAPELYTAHNGCALNLNNRQSAWKVVPLAEFDNQFKKALLEKLGTEIRALRNRIR